MNPLNNNPNSAFSAVARMEAQIHANVLGATEVAQNVREYTAPADSAQVLRAQVAHFIGDLVGPVEAAYSIATSSLNADAAKAASQGDVLRGQLSKIDVEIKQLVQEIEAKRTEEQDA